LKGSGTTLEVKRFFYRKLQHLDFKLYSVTINKKRLVGRLMEDKERIYNHLARMTLERVDFKDAAVRVIMAVDMFAWGIFRKYEAQDRGWFDIFREKMAFEKLYLP